MEPVNLYAPNSEDVPTVPFPPPSQPGSSATTTSTRESFSDRDSDSPFLADITSRNEDDDQSEDNFGDEDIQSGHSESLNPPKYSDFSDVFNKEEYLRITEAYELMGLGAWLDLTTYPIFRSRGAKVLALCQMLEEFHVKQRVRLEEEEKDGTAQRLSQNNYSLTKLNENARERKRQRTKSPTSSSSNYGSAPSVRSRASWSGETGEFPYAYPSGIPDRKPFLDSDDYVRRKDPLLNTKEPRNPSIHTDYSPVEVAANSIPPSSRDPSPYPSIPSPVPPVPATPSTTSPPPDLQTSSCTCSSLPSEPCPVHPPLKERIQRIFRRLPGRKRQRI